MAILGVVAMLGGFLASSALQQSTKRPLFGSAVVVLSLANGLVGIVHYFGAPGWLLQIRLNQQTLSLT